MSTDQPQVDNKSVAYREMEDDWELSSDLLGGTRAMRSAGKRWLPKEDIEKDATYNLRLEQSVLFNAYGDTIASLVSKPFSKPATTTEDFPDYLESMVHNIDKSGHNLTQFARMLFRTALSYGVTHVLVDYPNTGGRITLAQERQHDIRPVAVEVTPQQLIGWTVVDDESGPTLTSIRIKEQRLEEVEQYKDAYVNYIREITDVDWRLWKQVSTSRGDKVMYVIVAEGTHTFGRVPLVTYNIRETGFMTAKLPLEDLAWMNIAHWQSQSDQRNILRFARAALVHAKGFEPNDLVNFGVGPNALIKSTNVDSEIKYVEHSGAAIGAGADDIKHLEERMEILGLKPLIERTNRSTATGKQIDQANTTSDIQSWVRGLEDCLKNVFKIAAEWMNKTEQSDDCFTVDIFNDFGISARTGEELNAILKLRENKIITHETCLREVKRRGVLSDVVDITTELEATEKEAEDSLKLAMQMVDSTYDENNNDNEDNE